MITGHNSEVEYAGRVYHVQTEDKGRSHPIIETLIYSKGEILDTKRSSYADLLEKGCDERDVIRRMDEQHRRCLREVRNGRYDAEGPRPFGWNIITNRSFDEVVLETLKSGATGSHLTLETVGENCFFEGTAVVVELAAKLSDPAKTAAGATVKVKLIRSSGKPVTLFEGKTDAEGRLKLGVEIPAMNGG